MSSKIAIWAVILLALGGAVCADPPPPTQPDPISLDRLSPSVTGFGNLPADIYGEAGGVVAGGWDVGGPGPVLHVPVFAYGLQPPDNADAVSLGHNDPNWLPIVYFSASRKSLGAWGTQYRHQAVRTQAAGDRFVTNGWLDRSPMAAYLTGSTANLIVWQAGRGPNLLSANQTRYNEIPSIPTLAVNPTGDPLQIDEMDALELHPLDINGDAVHDFPMFFSMDGISMSMPPIGSPADVFVSWPMTPGFSTWATAASMGLGPNDDIDALTVFHTSGSQQAMPGQDWAIFSLRAGNSLGASPADVLVTCFQGVSRLYVKAGVVGLLGSDDIDGLDIEPSDPAGQGFPQIFDPIEEPALPVPIPIPPVRPDPDGTPVNVFGIVTLIGPDYLYIESPGRESGIRVETAGMPAWYVSVGDELQVMGTLGRLDGERVIFPSMPVSPMSFDNPVPAPFNMRTRAVGGDDLDIWNPGVTNGRGALNVGLLARVTGMVTAIEPSACPHWFYIWDGANSNSQPVSDGTGNLGIRVEGGYLGTPWKDWVEVIGVVSTDASLVPGCVAPTLIPTCAPSAVSHVEAVHWGKLLPQWNLIAAPVAPALTGDGVEHSAKAWDPPMVFAGGDPAQLDSSMQRWESCTQGLYIYDIWSDDHTSTGGWGPFGGVILGDGYWLTGLTDPFDVTYPGIPSFFDEWVSVCEPGWALIGHPKDNDMPWADASVHNGNSIESLFNASLHGLGWLNSYGFWWDATSQGLCDVGIPDDFPTYEDLYRTHGYWFEFYQGNKSLVFPGDPIAAFSQIDFDLDGMLTPDSEWGSLDLTLIGDPGVQYLNVSVNGSWQVQNIPVLSAGAPGTTQTLNYCFDLGTPRGLDVSQIDYGFSLTTDPVMVPPVAEKSAEVTNRRFVVYSGIDDLAGPEPLEPAVPLIGAPAAPAGTATQSVAFPNQECGKNECVPAAVSNSLKYLNNKHKLGMSDTAMDISNMKTATGWTSTGCGYGWYNTKSAYMADKKLPITTVGKTVPPNDIGGLVSEVAAGNDVELVAIKPSGKGGHCVAVTGITKQADGKYSVQITHDTKQGEAGGTKTETVTYDPATGKFTGGSLNGWSLHHTVVESPKKP